MLLHCSYIVTYLYSKPNRLSTPLSAFEHETETESDRGTMAGRRFLPVLPVLPYFDRAFYRSATQPLLSLSRSASQSTKAPKHTHALSLDLSSSLLTSVALVSYTLDVPRQRSTTLNNAQNAQHLPS